MRVVVTGGIGFIGRHVVRELAGRGHDVLALDSLRPDVHQKPVVESVRRRLAADGARLARADVRDLAAAADAVTGAGAVVHLAAKVGLGIDLDDMDDYVSTNAVGTAVLLRALAAGGVRRLVQASSMVVYGEGHYVCHDHGSVRPSPRSPAALQAGRFEPTCPSCGAELAPGLVSEDAPLDPRNTYAATKVAQEHLAGVWARETGAQALSLRLHNVYGPGMPRSTPYAGVAALFAGALDRGEAPRVFEDGNQRRDFVHVSDIARAFAVAVEAADGTGPRSDRDSADRSSSAWPSGAWPSHDRTYNVGSGVVSTVGDMARALSASRSGPQPVITGQFRLGDVRHITASSARIAAELGFAAGVSLEEGLRGLSFD